MPDLPIMTVIYGDPGRPARVWHEGRRIADKTHHPLRDGARALVDKGLLGEVHVFVSVSPRSRGNWVGTFDLARLADPEAFPTMREVTAKTEVAAATGPFLDVTIQKDVDGSGYHALLGDIPLCVRSPDPEYDAARALVLLGYAGRMRTRRMGSPHHALIFRRDVAWMARRYTHSIYEKTYNDADYEAAMARARKFLGLDAPAA